MCHSNTFMEPATKPPKTYPQLSSTTMRHLKGEHGDKGGERETEKQSEHWRGITREEEGEGGGGRGVELPSNSNHSTTTNTHSIMHQTKIPWKKTSNTSSSHPITRQPGTDGHRPRTPILTCCDDGLYLGQKK